MDRAPMNRQNFYVGLLLVLLLAIAGSTTIIVKKVESSPAVKTCEVQNRGLRAGRHLLNVVKDIETLVTPYAGEKPQPPLPPAQATAVLNLREEAGAYVTIQDEQPPGRHC